MSKYESSFRSAIVDSERRICIDLLRGSPEMTLSDLNKLARGSMSRLFAEITVSDLLGGEPQSDAAPRSGGSEGGRGKGRGRGGDKTGGGRARSGEGGDKAPKAGKAERTERAEKPARADKPAKAEKQAAVEVNTRTPAGREAFDGAVFAIVEAAGGAVSASEVQRKIGGTNLQLRAALNRLIEAGRLTWSGKARGTRYSLA